MCGSGVITFGQSLMAFVGYGIAVVCIGLALLGVLSVFDRSRPSNEKASDVGLIIFLLFIAYVVSAITLAAIRTTGC